MEVFYLKKEEFLNSINIKSLEEFSDGRAYSSEVKYEQHLCGLFLTKFIAKNVYGLKNTDIVLRGAKPVFASNKMNFSISHSNNIVLVAFNNFNIGADVEFMRRRDYKDILQRYTDTPEDPTREEFYRFWTLHEAQIKLDNEPRALFSAILEKDYMFTCVSDNVLVTNSHVKKLMLSGDGIDLVSEHKSPKQIQLKVLVA